MEHTTITSFSKSRPALSGLLGVLALASVGAGVAFATGLVTPAQVEAFIITPPCCVVTPPPPPPPPPLPPVPPVPPLPPVPPVVPPTPPECTLSASPTTTAIGGGPSTLTWTTTNATSATINHGVGAVTPVAGGSEGVTVAVTTTYTMTATGPDGTATCSATVTVPPPVNPPPTCTLDATPATLTAPGNATLTWTTTNATSATINHGVGAVTPVAGGSTTAAVPSTRTYTLTATGPGGTVECSDTVTVTVDPSVPVCTLSASPTSIGNGGSSTLTWTTTNAVSFSLNQSIGAVTPVAGGTRGVNPPPDSTTTYTGTATHANGATATCTASVTTTGGGGGGLQCSLSISAATINPGGQAQLSWSSNGGVTHTIDQGIGAVDPNGLRTISHTAVGTYVYTYTVKAGNLEKVCTAQIQVIPGTGCSGNCGGGNPSPTVTLDLKRPPTAPLAFISLSQVPYTGIELTPAGMVVYWSVLILWSAAIAYLVLFTFFPFVRRRAAAVALLVKDAFDDEDMGPRDSGIPAPKTPTPAPAALAVPAPARPLQPAPAKHDGFRRFAGGEVLSIEDIVQGLSRLPVGEGIYVAEEPNAPHAAVASRTDAGFLASLMKGDAEGAYAALRDAGDAAQDLLADALCDLDDAYRARRAGKTCDPKVADACASCDDDTLEEVIDALTSAVDTTYRKAEAGAKMAVARALRVIRR